jgi:predicted transcriptional regulator
MQQSNGVLISFRVDDEVASAMATVAADELITRADIARRAIVYDLRRRGRLPEAKAPAAVLS